MGVPGLHVFSVISLYCDPAQQIFSSHSNSCHGEQCSLRERGPHLGQYIGIKPPASPQYTQRSHSPTQQYR